MDTWLDQCSNKLWYLVKACWFPQSTIIVFRKQEHLPHAPDTVPQYPWPLGWVLFLPPVTNYDSDHTRQRLSLWWNSPPRWHRRCRHYDILYLNHYCPHRHLPHPNLYRSERNWRLPGNVDVCDSRTHPAKSTRMKLVRMGNSIRWWSTCTPEQPDWFHGFGLRNQVELVQRLLLKRFNFTKFLLKIP